MNRAIKSMKWCRNEDGTKSNLKNWKMAQWAHPLLCKCEVWLSDYSEGWTQLVKRKMSPKKWTDKM